VSEDPAHPPPDRFFAVVRRGETEIYQTLQQTFAEELDLMEVLWDRRVAERRAKRQGGVEPERRQGERRRSLPPTWATLGFVIARVQAEAR
jgi:hypothetical protein